MSKIKNLKAKKILDSRGQWTIEVGIETSSGLRASASVPQGKSSGSSEAHFVSADNAVKNVNTKINKYLKNENPHNQNHIDSILLELDGTKNKRKLGGNAILGVSIAVAKIAALEAKIGLWEHFRKQIGVKISKKHAPRLFINMINGGLHAGNNLDFQEYLVIPKGNIQTQVKIGTLIYADLQDYLSKYFGPGTTGLGDEGGFAPNFKDNLQPFEILKKIIKKNKLTSQIDLGMDAAASGIKKSASELTGFYEQVIKKYNILYLEDPYDEMDFSSFSELNQKHGKKLWVCGDDLTTTNVELIKGAEAKKAINSIIIKPNQIGTITETLNAVALARKLGWKIVVSHRSGETNDDFVADLAYGVGADGFKLGAPARGERIAKYNRLLEIQ